VRVEGRRFSEHISYSGVKMERAQTRVVSLNTAESTKKEQDFKTRIKHEEDALRDKILKKSEARSLDEDELELVRAISLTKQAEDMVKVKDNRKNRTQFIEHTRQRQREREQARATVLDTAIPSSPINPLMDYPSLTGNKRNGPKQRRTVLEVQRQQAVSVCELSGGSFRDVGMRTKDAVKAADGDDKENLGRVEGRTKAKHHGDDSAQTGRKERYSGKTCTRREVRSHNDPSKARYDCAQVTKRAAKQTSSRSRKGMTLQSSLYDHFTKTPSKSSTEAQACPTPDHLPLKRSRDHTASVDQGLSKRIKGSEAETVKKRAPAVLTDFCDRLLKTCEFLPEEVNVFNVLMLALSGHHPNILRPCNLSSSSLPYKVDAVKDGVHIILQEEQREGKKFYYGVKVFADPVKEPLYWTRFSGRERKYV
jgi:hypothetical protein